MADPVVEPRPAATVVLLRPGAAGPELLLTHRPSTMAFAADMQVFPGGRVDERDADPRLVARSPLPPDAAAAALGGDLPPAAAHAAYVAAIREAFEEVGVLLAEGAAAADRAALDDARDRLLAGAVGFADLVEELDLRLRTDALVPLSRWVTPPDMPRRFDARVFVAEVPADVEATLVGDEVAAHGWWTPRAALDAMADGRIGMWLPTSTTLQQLEHVPAVDALRDALPPTAAGPVRVRMIDDELTAIDQPWGGGIAGRTVTGYAVGRRELVVIDPGDPTGPALEAMVDVAASRGGRLVAIALTHADPDHAAGAEALALRCGIPVLASPLRARDLPYAVKPLADGEDVDLGDVPLRVVATPGPAMDHVAFVMGAGTRVISGDLQGPRGPAVLRGPDDQAATSASVRRLRAAAPDATWFGGHPPSRRTATPA